MTVQITVTFRSRNPNTIWNKLAMKLGREPTHAEACAEVSRIKRDTVVDLASRGKLQHQR